MKMVVGGAYQGKLSWAREHLWKTYRHSIENEKENLEEWIDGDKCDKEGIYRCAGIYHFHKYIARFLNAEDLPKDFAKDLLKKNPDLIIVTEEIGYGIVPLDPGERSYREQVGRVCTGLASEAEEVYRVICGIGVRIK